MKTKIVKFSRIIMEDEKEQSSSQFENTIIGDNSPSLASISNHSVEWMHTGNYSKKVTIVIGKFQQDFRVDDLQLLSYFEALFSTRWKVPSDEDSNNKQQRQLIQIGDNNTLLFGIEELCTIIHIKKHHQIPINYSYKKLILLCNAADFFSEDMLNEELFIDFFKKCKPSLSFKTLNELTKGKHTNKLIKNSATKYLRGIQQNIHNMKQKWLEKYKQLPISHVSFDDDMIAAIFVRSFSIQWVQMHNETKRKWLIQCGNIRAFFQIWDIIKKRELYKYNKSIFECIEKMCNDIDISVPVHHNVDDSVLVILKKVFLETMQIVVEFNKERKPSHSKYRSYSDRNLLLYDDNENANGNEDDDEEDEDKQDTDGIASLSMRMSGVRIIPLSSNRSCDYFDYHKFNLEELIRTHFEFVIVNRRKYFEIDELKQLLATAHGMNGPQKYSFLKFMLSFHQQWIENISSNTKMDKQKQTTNLSQPQREDYILCWMQLLQYLISSEVDYSINVVHEWLPIFIDESKFVLNTVANALSTDGSHKLAFAIANYVTSHKIVDKTIDPQYMQYLYQSLGISWKLHKSTVLPQLHDEDANDIQSSLFNV